MVDREEQMQSVIERFNAGRIEDTEEAGRVISRASRIFDYLNGVDPNVGILEEDIEVITTPGIPVLMARNLVCDLGEFYARVFVDTTPSSSFTAGFYAAALLARHGLVDPAEFQTDTEIMRRHKEADTRASTEA